MYGIMVLRDGSGFGWRSCRRVVNDVLLDLFEQICGKDEIVESLVGSGVDFLHIAHPLAAAVAQVDDVFAYAEHRVHVVGIDYRGDVVLVCDVAEQFVDEDGGMRVKAGVWFVAKEILGIQCDGTSNRYTLLHTARNLRWILVVRTFEVDTFKAELCAVLAFGGCHVGKHHQREHHIAKHCL